MRLKKIIKNKYYTFLYNNIFVQRKIYKNKTLLITGCNSGIGLSLVKNLLNYNNKIYATFNKNCCNLIKIKNKKLFLIKCDQSNIKSVGALKNIFAENQINVIINNACFAGGDNQDFYITNFKQFNKALTVNMMSVLKISQLAIKFSKKNCLEKIVNISSETGSIEQNLSGGRYIYRISKSALNALTKNMSIDLYKKYNIEVVAIHPGLIQTKMNPQGLINSDNCAKKIINLLAKSNLNGKFLDLMNYRNINW
tara:strand:+ start:106 stop:864 length:759 start_codon:yes stop_codon:yes gene_type:complete